MSTRVGAPTAPPVMPVPWPEPGQVAAEVSAYATALVGPQPGPGREMTRRRRTRPQPGRRLMSSRLDPSPGTAIAALLGVASWDGDLDHAAQARSALLRRTGTWTTRRRPLVKRPKPGN